MSIFEIPVIDYASDTGDCIRRNVFEINKKQLAVGIMRVLCAKKPSKDFRKIIKKSAMDILNLMIDPSRSGGIYINSEYVDVISSDKKNIDVGKLAESICYCYWYWGGKYRFINGFLPYAKREGITIEARSKHADFIMTNISGSNAIMESKGTLRKKYNEPMNEALTQVRSVMPYVKAKEGWGCVVTFNYPDGPASLHLRDPMDDKFIPDRISYEIFRSSFASWFELFDMDDVAVWCRNPNPTNELSKSNLLNRMNDCSKNNFLTKRLFDVLGFNSQKAKFRLNPLILDFLFDYSNFKEIKYEPLKYNHAKTIIRENEPFLCPDGMEIWPE